MATAGLAGRSWHWLARHRRCAGCRGRWPCRTRHQLGGPDGGRWEVGMASVADDGSQAVSGAGLLPDVAGGRGATALPARTGKPGPVGVLAEERPAMTTVARLVDGFGPGDGVAVVSLSAPDLGGLVV